MEINWGNNPLKSITETMQKLTAVIQRENNFLKAMKISEIQNLQEEKMALTHILETAQRRVALDPGVLGKVAEKDKKLFEAAGAEFTAAMQENYQELVKAREVNKKIVELIALAASHHYKSTSGYNKNGSHAGISIGVTKRPESLPPISYVGQA